jgi:hypothetical protein
LPDFVVVVGHGIRHEQEPHPPLGQSILKPLPDNRYAAG